MPNYRRAHRPGGTFFFTLVTYRRRPILATELGRRLLHEALAVCGRRWLYSLDAIVLLPDHLHAIWTLPAGDADFSTRWAAVKRAFTAGWLRESGDAIAEGERWQRRRSVWQPRFYEHTLRDELDLERHYDYLHFNPVKHGLATCPHAWAWSSFRRCAGRRIYPPDWLCVCNARRVNAPDFSWAEELEME
jgi:putative transposase